MKNSLLLKRILLMSVCTFPLFALQIAFAGVLLASDIVVGQDHSDRHKSLDEIPITINAENITLKEAFDLIHYETGFTFAFVESKIPAEKRVDIHVHATSLEDLLLELSRDANLAFRRINNRIQVSKKTKNTRRIIEEIPTAQQQKITGKVISSEDDQGLPGVNVIVKGTSQGTVTDVEGNYSLDVPGEETVLVFSSVGYVQEEIAVGTQTVIDVSMVPDITSLEEIVVVGYGAQKKTNLTGSVSDIKTDDILYRPVTNISAGLSGLAPGVLVTQSHGGQAGNDGAIIRIRGIGTFNNSNPLIVVDGVPSESTSHMDDIDPNDIENISILKDAASAAIYGSRGANGVVLITTKKGVEGKPVFSYSGYAGLQKATRKLDMVSDFALYMEQANISSGSEVFDPADIQAWRDNPNDPLRYPNVDWYNEFVGSTSGIQSHNLAFRGGTEATQYRFSVSYLDQDGLLYGNNAKRYGIRTNLQSEVTKGVKMGGNLFFRWSDITPGRSWIDTRTPPGVPNIQHPDGRWGAGQQAAINSYGNPLAAIDKYKSEITEQRLLGDIFASWEIVSGLTVTGRLALNYNHEVRNSFASQYDLWDFKRDVVTLSVNTSGSHASSSQYQDYLLTANLLLDYVKSVGKHNFKVLGGYESLQFRNDAISASKLQFPNNEVQALNAGLIITGAGGNFVEWGMLSYFGRFNYDFGNKYLFEANFRADGSSRFKEDNRWGYFPAFSVGWLLSEESFMKGVSFIDQLKLRGSWGQLGNNRIGNYDYQPTYTINQNYSTNGKVLAGVAQTRLVNEDIKWEVTTTTDFGLDASFFEGKLSLTADYFHRETEGILTELPIPNFLGDKSNPTVNLASMVNEGFEISLGYRGKVGDLSYNVSGHITQTDNKVTDYFEDIKTGGTQIGYPYNSYFGYEAVGIFRTQEQLDNAPFHTSSTGLGDIEFKDQFTEDTDGDGIPDAGDGVIDSDDRVIIGKPIPKYFYGGNIGLQYKAFDLGIIFQGVAGRDVNTLYQAIKPLAWDVTGALHQRWVDEAWSQDNPDGELPRMYRTTFHGLSDDRSDFWVKDVSFFRVKNIQLGYSLPSTFINKLGMKKFRIYASSDNLLTLTNEEWGADPETANGDGIPNVTTFILGVNIEF
ncbi:MAG: TonB-dependent receptor [Cytophagales bacterium]|nr:TonB-dependent receptor [Cytophagales bacterium]